MSFDGRVMFLVPDKQAIFWDTEENSRQITADNNNNSCSSFLTKQTNKHFQMSLTVWSCASLMPVASSARGQGWPGVPRGRGCQNHPLTDLPHCLGGGACSFPLSHHLSLCTVGHGGSTFASSLSLPTSFLVCGKEEAGGRPKDGPSMPVSADKCGPLWGHSPATFEGSQRGGDTQG